ncbi:hypothetical protein BJ165DRAFT_1397434 [Panaeolus papilionaceus]|nr:hypothetical protein BJ165DRAFT_1397434 [Panaeolus papilionaceus]
MTTLIIGATGNTGCALAKLMCRAGHPVILTSRSGVVPEPCNSEFKPYIGAVAFDWTKPSTFLNPFRFAADSSVKIEKVYFIPPSADGTLGIVRPFLDQAVKRGVKKFVMLAASVTTPGGKYFCGDILKYFIDGPLDYTVLRPTWFMQNFRIEYLKSLKEENYFYTACDATCKTAPISSDDIAQAAFEALLTPKFSRQAPFIFGPQLLSFDEVAQVLSSVLGRSIFYKRISAERRAQIYESYGMSKADAKAIADAEINSSKNRTEEKVFLDPNQVKYIGRTTVKEYVKANAALWM